MIFSICSSSYSVSCVNSDTNLLSVKFLSSASMKFLTNSSMSFAPVAFAIRANAS